MNNFQRIQRLCTRLKIPQPLADSGDAMGDAARILEAITNRLLALEQKEKDRERLYNDSW